MIGNRQQIWNAARELGVFTVKELRQKSGLTGNELARKYVYGWEAAGYVEKIGENPISYSLLDRTIAVAPAVNLAGQKIRSSQIYEQMWRVMRIIKEFSAIDLAVASSTEECSVSEEDARAWLKILAVAGYVRKSGKRYRFVESKFKGPAYPIMQRLIKVTDGNTGECVFLGTSTGREETR